MWSQCYNLNDTSSESSVQYGLTHSACLSTHYEILFVTCLAVWAADRGNLNGVQIKRYWGKGHWHSPFVILCSNVCLMLSQVMHQMYFQALTSSWRFALRSNRVLLDRSPLVSSDHVPGLGHEFHLTRIQKKYTGIIDKMPPAYKPIYLLSRHSWSLPLPTLPCSRVEARLWKIQIKVRVAVCTYRYTYCQYTKIRPRSGSIFPLTQIRGRPVASSDCDHSSYSSCQCLPTRARCITHWTACFFLPYCINITF